MLLNTMDTLGGKLVIELPAERKSQLPMTYRRNQIVEAQKMQQRLLLAQ